MIETFDAYVPLDEVHRRLSNGAAFSLLTIDQHQRGCYGVRGFAFDPIAFGETSDKRDYAFHFFCHHFSAGRLWEEPFIKQQAVSDCLGQLNYLASTRIELSWSKDMLGQADEEFKKCFIQPGFSRDNNLSDMTVTNTRNVSLYPVFNTDKDNRKVISSVTRPSTDERTADTLVSGTRISHYFHNFTGGGSVELVTHPPRNQVNPKFTTSALLGFLKDNIVFSPLSVIGAANKQVYPAPYSRMVANSSTLIRWTNSRPLFPGTLSRPHTTAEDINDITFDNALQTILEAHSLHQGKNKAIKQAKKETPKYSRFSRERDL
jgi:hypothetical protein